MNSYSRRGLPSPRPVAQLVEQRRAEDDQNEMAEQMAQEGYGRDYKDLDPDERRAINELFGCLNCGGPLPSERDQETGTCKPCRVTEGM